ISVGAGAMLEWLPLESILFDEADAVIGATVTLADDAVFAGWEIACLGRRASGETFRRGALRQSLEIRRERRLIWNDRLALDGADRMLAPQGGVGGPPVARSVA